MVPLARHFEADANLVHLYGRVFLSPDVAQFDSGPNLLLSDPARITHGCG
jgi:hypothetical protein